MKGTQALGALLALCCLASCIGAWEVHVPTQEAFIGWRGETYLAPPASPPAAAAAEPLVAGSSADTSSVTTDTASVDQLEDIPAGAAPSILPPAAAATSGAPAAAAAPAEAPTVAADQHTIDVSIKRTQYNSYDDAEAPWVQHLSWHPRLHLHHNFLTPEECDKMQELLARPSGVVGGSNAGAESAADEEASLMLMLDIEHRVANWTALPPNHLEGWQLQHGFQGGDAVLHTDLLTDRLATEDYQRFRSATVLLFLGDEPSGPSAGDAGSSSKNWSLVFPIARGGAWRGSAVPFEYKGILEQGKQVEQKLKASQSSRRGEPNEVLKLHIATHQSIGSSSSDGQGFCDGSVQAGLTLTGFQKGSALLIWNLLTDNQTPDASAAHLFCLGGQQASMPWIATTWLHNMPFGQDSAMALASVCEDTNPACSTWAAQGFCDDAANQMIGLRGMCRRSCQDCRSCDSLRPVRPQGTDSKVASSMPSLKAYMDCIYANMHSLRQEWSEAARGPGVRKARNAIRRDMRFQAANGLITGHSAPSKQQSSWSTVW